MQITEAWRFLASTPIPLGPAPRARNDGLLELVAAAGAAEELDELPWLEAKRNGVLTGHPLHVPLRLLFVQVAADYAQAVSARKWRADFDGAASHNRVVGESALVHDERDFRVGLDVAVLLRTAAGAHNEDAAVIEVPYRRGVGAAAAVHRREDGDVRFGEEGVAFFGSHGGNCSRREPRMGADPLFGVNEVRPHGERWGWPGSLRVETRSYLGL